MRGRVGKPVSMEVLGKLKCEGELSQVNSAGASWKHQVKESTGEGMGGRAMI